MDKIFKINIPYGDEREITEVTVQRRGRLLRVLTVRSGNPSCEPLMKVRRRRRYRHQKWVLYQLGWHRGLNPSLILGTDFDFIYMKEDYHD